MWGHWGHVAQENGAPSAQIQVHRGPTSHHHGDMGYTLGLAATPKDPLSLDIWDNGT